MKDSRTIRLVQTLLPFQKQIIASLFFIILHTAVGFGLIYTASRFELKSFPLFIIVLFSLHHILSVFDDWLLSSISQKWIEKIRHHAMSHFLHTQDVHQNTHLAWDQIQQEIHWIGEALFCFLRSSARKIFQLVVFSLALVTLSVDLFIICIGLFFMVTVSGLLMGKWINRTQEKLIDENSRNHVFEMEIVRGFSLIRAFGSQRKLLQRHQDLLASATRTRILLNRLRLIHHPVQIVLFLLTIFLVHSRASVLLQNGQIQQSTYFAFISGLSLLHAPLSGLVQDISFFLSLKHIQHMNEIIPPKIKSQSSEKTNEIIEQIDINNLFFSYREKSPLLQNINMTLKKGFIHGITGPNGSGKSTLGLLIAGVYKPDSGSILFDGKPFQPKISYVDQNGYVFSMPLKDNLFIKPESEIKSGFLVDFITDENAVLCQDNLSSGQKKLISFARGFQGSGNIYIIDEPENAIDRNRQKEVQNLILQKSRDSIFLIISHSEEFLQLCHTRYVL